MVNENWLKRLNAGRDKIDFVIKGLGRLSEHFDAVGNEKIANQLSDYVFELSFGLSDINQAIDNHLTTEVKQVQDNVGTIFKKILEMPSASKVEDGK